MVRLNHPFHRLEMNEEQKDRIRARFLLRRGLNERAAKPRVYKTMLFDDALWWRASDTGKAIGVSRAQLIERGLVDLLNQIDRAIAKEEGK